MKNKHLTYKLEARELSNFFEQLTMYLKSGISSWEAMLLISQNESNVEHKDLFDFIFDDFSGGNPFSEAITHSGAFPEYAIGMIRIGEQTGRMEEVSEALTQFYRDRQTLQKLVRKALVYPSLMAAMILVVILVMLTQVMPIFQDVFIQLGLSINPVSAFLLDLGNVFNQYGATIAIVIFCIIGILIVLSLTSAGKGFIKKLVEKSVITKKLSRAEATTKFAFSMSILMNTGVEMISAFDFVHSIVGNEYIKQIISNMKQDLENGEALLDVLTKYDLFTRESKGMITAGVRCGNMSEMLMSVSDKYHEDVQEKTEKLLAIVEPILLAILCALVGMVMLSVVLPLVGMLSNM